MTDLIDSHAHVWDHSCTMIPGARHRPAYEATIKRYLDVLDAHGIEKAVLVQPSFLGTDNTYLLDCLRAHPDRLRGIVVADPALSTAEMEDMTALGVIGHRLNMVGRDVAILATAPYGDLTRRASALLWWTEVQAPGPAWPNVIEALHDTEPRYMVDHFGLPSGPDCPGIAAIARLDLTRTSLKLSAPYRQLTPDHHQAIQPLLGAQQGPHLLWGSDWPWTQHEAKHSYHDCMEWLKNWTTTDARRHIARADAALGF